MKLSARRLICMFAILIFAISTAVVCLAAETDGSEWEEIFTLAADVTESDSMEVGAKLSEAFYAEPVEFIKALAQMDLNVQETVAILLAQYHASMGSSTDYLEFVLSFHYEVNVSIVDHERETLLNILIWIDNDVNDVDAEFLSAVFTAFAHQDGAGSEFVGGILFNCFLKEPKLVIQEIAAKDLNSQECYTFTLNYQCQGRSSENQYIEIVKSLASDDTLDDPEKNVADTLLQLLTSAEEDTTVPSTGQEVTAIPESAGPSAESMEETLPSPVAQEKNSSVWVVALISILLLSAAAYFLVKNKKI